MKRILSFILSIALVFTLLPAQPALATDGSSSGEDFLDAFFDIIGGLIGGGIGGGESGDERPPYESDEEDTPAYGVQTGLKEDKALADWSKFRDVQGHWAETTLKWAVDNGLMCGRTSTMMEPDGTITRAEMVTMITRAFGAFKKADISFFHDVNESHWYYDEFQRIVAMGVFVGYGNAVKPNEAVTRQEVATLLVRAAGFVLQPQSYLHTFSDYKTCDIKKADYLATAIYHGIIKGYPDGTCRPYGEISRAEFAAMLSRLAYIHINNVTTSSVKNTGESVLVGAGVVGIHDLYINKNLFLADGVDADTITLDNITVADTIYVRGAANIVITGKSKVNNIVLCNPHAAVKLTIGKDATVGNVYVQDGESGVAITGKLSYLYVNVPEVPVRLDDVEVEDVILASPFCGVRATKNTEIVSLSITADARGATAELLGEIDDLVIAAEDSTVSVNNKVGSLVIGPTADGMKLVIGESASVNTIDVAVDDLSLSFGGVISYFNLTGSNNSVRFADNTAIASLNVSGEGNAVLLGNDCLVVNMLVKGNRNKVNAPKAEIETFNFTGEDCSLNWGAGKSDKLTVSGKDFDVTLGMSTDIRTLVLEGVRYKLTAEGEVKYFNTNVDELRATIAGTIDELSLYGEDQTVTISAACNHMTVEAIESQLILSGECTNVFLNGEGNTVDITGDFYYVIVGGYTYAINVNGEVYTMEIRSSDVILRGQGVDYVVVTWGTDIYILLGDAIVQNNGKNIIYAGGEPVNPGETVQIEGDGSGLVKTEEDEEDGKDDEDEDDDEEDEKEDDEKPVDPIVPALELRLAERVSANYIFRGNSYPYTNFVENMSYDPATGRLTGTVKYITDFVAYSNYPELADGYFIPMYIVSAPTTDESILTIGECEFGKEAVSNSVTVGSHWMVPLYLDYLDPDKIATITYDVDGDGDKYAPATVVIDFSGVNFTGGPAADALYERAVALPGIDGAETANLSITSMNNRQTFVYSLTTKCLLETRDVNGRYGYWTGIKLPAPLGAAKANLAISAPDGTNTTLNLRVNNGWIGWQVNAACVTDTVKEVIATITWFDEQGNRTNTDAKTLVLNLAGVVKAGDVVVTPPTPEEPAPEPVDIVTNFVLSGVSPEECVEQFGRSITTFAVGYNISNNSVSGTFVLEDGVFYIPVKITGTASESAVIYYEDKSMTIISEAGEFTKYVLIPAEIAVQTLRDFKIRVKAAEINSTAKPFEMTVDCTYANYTRAAIIVNDVIPADSVGGKNIAQLISTPVYSAFFNTLTIEGAANKIAKYSYYGREQADMWLAPVEMFVLAPDDDWMVTVKCGDEVFATFTAANLDTRGMLTILVPLGVGNRTFDSISIVMTKASADTADQSMGSVVIYNDATLVGMQTAA